MSKKAKSRYVKSPQARAAGADAPTPVQESSSDKPIYVIVPHERKWWETWWGTSIILTVTGILAGVMVWQVTDHFSKPSTVTVGPDGKLISMTGNGIIIKVSSSDASSTSAAPNSVPPAPSVVSVNSDLVNLPPDVKQAIAKQVEAQLKETANTTSETPPALDPAHRTFVVDSRVTVSTNGRKCSLTAGDVITRLTDRPDPDQTVYASVSASKKGDCAWGQTVSVKVEDLQEMYNHFQEQLDSGMGELARHQSTGLPKPSPENALEAERALADETERAVADEVKAQGRAERANANAQGPPVLDSGQRTFVVDSDVKVVANGQECALTSGDLITRLTDTPGADQTVYASVSATKKGDCPSGQTIAVKVADLQEMYDQFQKQITNGMGDLNKKSTGSSHQSPKN